MLGCLHSWMCKFVASSNFQICCNESSYQICAFYNQNQKNKAILLTLVIIPQCHSFVILVIKPPFYLPNSSPVEHISMHAYSIGWHLSCYHPPSQPRLLPYFPLVHVVCKCVACCFDNTSVWNLCLYYYTLQKKVGQE